MNKITIEEFEKRVKERFPIESFTVIEYSSYGKPATLKCNTCGQEISVSKAGNFLAPTKAYGCKKCHGLWRERECKLALIRERYDILDDTEVRGTHKYYTVKCKKCGHVRRSALTNLSQHLECGCETGVFRRTKDEIKEQLLDMDYELLSNYKGMTEKVLVRHISCGFIRNVRTSDLLYGESRCPRCERKDSRGVQFITNLLTKSNIPFIKEQALENGQRFDFFLPWCNTAIEYNGEQHYHYVEFFHSGSTSFEKQQERDQKKAQYCKGHGIRLLVIPYTDSSDEIQSKIQLIVNEFNDQSKDVESSDSK